MDRYYRLAAGVACDLSHNGGLHPCRWAAIHGETASGYPRPCMKVHRAAPGHHARACLGNCSEHPLITGDVAVMWILENAAGFSGLWGRMEVDEDEAREEAESPEDRASREAKEMAEAIAASDAAAMQKKTARWTEHGGMKFRVPKPCRYASLYEKRICVDCEREGIRSVIPEGETVCRATIPARERKNHMGGSYTEKARICGAPFSGCHNHETRTCIYVHPDEREWADACSGRLDTRFDNRLVFCLATDPAAMRNNQRSAVPARGGARFVAAHGGRGGGQRSYAKERTPLAAAAAPNRFTAALGPKPQAQQKPQAQPKPQAKSRFGAFEQSSDEEDLSAW